MIKKKNRRLILQKLIINVKNIVMNYLNKIKNFTLSLKDKAFDKVGELSNIKIKKPNVKGFSKNPAKYIFYILTIILPVIVFFLLKDLKIFTIILISYATFLKYLNLCIFQRLCVFKNKEKCKLDVDDLQEALALGLGSFFFLWLSKTIYKLFIGK